MTKRTTRTPHARRRSHPRKPPQSLQEYLAGPPPVSQRALAQALGVNQSMVSMLAREKRDASARLIAKLHAVTGIPLKNLMRHLLAAKPRMAKARLPAKPPPAVQAVAP